MILSAQNISKAYQDSHRTITVLDGANLQVQAGELISITGQSGCGKSTLLHILGLLDDSDSGTIEIAGVRVNSRHPDAPFIRNSKIGFVFQFHYLVEDLTALENVALPLLIAGKKIAAAQKEAAVILEQLGLKDRITHFPNQLSGGEQQRVAFARALANKPSIVLADEPTGNLDPANSLELWKLMRQLNQDLRQTFVVVTHDREMAKLADKSFELIQGKLNQL